jgi:hypothetical protein
MPFITLPGLTGKIYLPMADCAAPRKNPCPDCFHCQACSDDRCQICLKYKDAPDEGLCINESTEKNNGNI